MFQNIYAEGLKKLLFDMLQQRYAENELTIDRLANSINNPKDYELMGKFLVAIYETAYLKAISEQKDLLKKYGINVEVTTPKNTEGKSIF